MSELSGCGWDYVYCPICQAQWAARIDDAPIYKCMVCLYYRNDAWDQGHGNMEAFTIGKYLIAEEEGENVFGHYQKVNIYSPTMERNLIIEDTSIEKLFNVKSVRYVTENKIAMRLVFG
jgi:hypothetical protein